MNNSQYWKDLVKAGIDTGQNITQIAKACYPYMGEPNKKRAYNLVKKAYYKITRGVASGSVSVQNSDLPIMNNKKGNEDVKPLKGVNAVTYRENGDAVFEGFLMLLEGKQASPEDVMAACNVDTEMWTITSYTCNVWQGQTKEGSDKNGKTNLWQFKVIMRPKKNHEISFDVIKKDFDELLKNGTPRYTTTISLPPKVKHKLGTGMWRELRL